MQPEVIVGTLLCNDSERFRIK